MAQLRLCCVALEGCIVLACVCMLEWVHGCCVFALRRKVICTVCVCFLCVYSVHEVQEGSYMRALTGGWQGAEEVEGSCASVTAGGLGLCGLKD